MTFKNDIISSGYMQLYRDWWSQAALLSWNDGSRRIDLYWFWSWTVKPLRFIILHTITEQLPPNICALFLFCLRLRHKCYIIYAKLHPWPVRHDLGGIYDTSVFTPGTQFYRLNTIMITHDTQHWFKYTPYVVVYWSHLYLKLAIVLFKHCWLLQIACNVPHL